MPVTTHTHTHSHAHTCTHTHTHFPTPHSPSHTACHTQHTHTQGDIYRPLALPALLVGDPALGGISTTLSAYESLLLRGAAVPAVVMMTEGRYNNVAAVRQHLQHAAVHRCAGGLVASRRASLLLSLCYCCWCGNSWAPLPPSHPPRTPLIILLAGWEKTCRCCPCHCASPHLPAAAAAAAAVALMPNWWLGCLPLALPLTSCSASCSSTTSSSWRGCTQQLGGRP